MLLLRRCCSGCAVVVLLCCCFVVVVLVVLPLCLFLCSVVGLYVFGVHCVGVVALLLV